MTLDEAIERLSPLPDRLPSGPVALLPVLAASGTRRPLLDAEPPVRHAAVLVLVVPGDNDDARVVLIERPTYDGYHSGEVSFPGGKSEPDDDGPVATALREAAEEVGLDPSASEVEILGLLDPVRIPVSGFHITPVVAAARRRPVLIPHPGEVVRIVEAPLEVFLPDAEIRVVERTIRDWELRFGVYPVDDLEVWGATARILGQLGAVLGRPSPQRP